MSAYPPGFEPPRNPETTRRHRQEVLWQITLPAAVGIIVILGLAVFTAVGLSAPVQSQMADISIVYLIMPVLVFGLITLVLLGGAAYGVTRLLALLPYQFLRLSIFFLRVQIGVHSFSNRLAQPIMSWHSFTARTRAFGPSLRGRPAARKTGHQNSREAR